MSKYYGLIIVLIGALYFFYDSILIIFPSSTINNLMTKFSVGATGIGFFSAIYFYLYAPLQIVNGVLINKFGPKTIIMWGFFICLLGLLLFMSSNNYIIGCISRGLMGIGASAGYIAPMMLIINWFDKKYYTVLTGMLILVECIGAVFGQIGLLILTNLFSLQYTLLVLIVLGMVLFMLTFFIVENYPDKKLIVVTKIIGISFKQSIRFLANSNLLKMSICATLLWSPIAIFATLWGINFINETYHISKLLSANLLILIWCGVGIGSPLSAYIANMVQSKLIVMLLLTILGFVASVLLICGGNLSKIEIGLILLAIGLASSAQVLTFGIIFDKISTQTTAIVFGFNNMCICFGNAITQGIASVLLDHYWDGRIINGIRVYSSQNYRQMMVMIPLCYLCVLLVCSSYWIKIKKPIIFTKFI